MGLRKKYVYRIRSIWSNMMSRCYKESNNRFQHYGKRGIVVCVEWHQYDVFKKWALSSGYDDALSIERIDVDSGYAPSNCRWATKTEQMNNKRNNRVLELNGEKKTLQQWANQYGVNQTRILRRINELGWSVNDAITKPTDKNKISKQIPPCQLKIYAE